MALLCLSSQLCNTSEVFTCPASLLVSLSSAYKVWISFCFLQMAFLVLGPEDPQIQLMGGKPTGCEILGRIPWDVIAVARVLPIVVLSMFVLTPASLSAGDAEWWSLLLTELLLVFCTGAFWTYRSSKGQSVEVLLRLKFWHRLLHQAIVPGVMLFFTYCLTGLSDQKAMRSVWYIVQAAFATSTLRTIKPEASTYEISEVLDMSSNNPNIAHILLGSTALVVVPTVIVGISYDWCSAGVGGSTVWPTISSARSCGPGGYFVAVVAVPAYVAAAAVFSLISSTTVLKTPWLQFSVKTFEEQYSPQRDVPDMEQRSLGKRLGCKLGYIGSGFGLLSALIMKGTPLRDMLTLLCGFISIGAMAIAMTLTVLSWDSPTRGFHFRRAFTLLVCLPILTLNTFLSLLTKFLPAGHSYPFMTYTISEYATVLLLALWPLTWLWEVQEEGQRKASGAFSWPKTNWRFDQ